MDSDFKKRQVSFDQLNALLDFLKEHNELAKGLTRGRRGKLQTLKIWNLCAKKLNVFKDGAIKDGKGWSKYWCDWKYRVRRRALELRAAKDSHGSPPDGVTQLSAMEETILSIIGDGAVDGIIIKHDPLADGATEEEEADSYHNEEPAANQYCETRLRSRRGRKRKHSYKDTSDMEECSESSPIDRKPRVGRQKNGHIDETENDNEATEFLRLEREKLENSKRLTDSIQTIASEITRLADVMSHIRDVLINNRINI
ncbi:uncharacterized protein LOC115443685 [Manduca sexta]|uniref:Regulatory protein zeste n=1 Tax=Manduca sexta TaxID=7130 RepID=A0A921Z3S9_MANSE|nr:uncharacterized protein LOC115443685 [Manduca sexta]XP_037297901.1 uncharacterized protein LOC115443685 [Manduca sexta]KAG6450430.1 hypothetical protein O3G_MSEX006564 [Manduca sexta]KAG6450431.1 hypothetical protein O3G_MSEX006564 [Manduca sexta]